jgi:hypothetical protein
LSTAGAVFFFGTKFSLFFQLKMSIDEMPQRDFIFSCPILPKEPLGFFGIMMMKSTCKHVSSLVTHEKLIGSQTLT